MTGAFLRVKRGNKWENIEIEQLTQDERKVALADKSAHELIRWIDMLCKVIQNVEGIYERTKK